MKSKLKNTIRAALTDSILGSDLFFRSTKFEEIRMTGNDARNHNNSARYGMRNALHFKSVRRFEHSSGWVKALLEEAENEGMHLMTFMKVTEPKWYERALVISAQGVFCTAYFAAYVLSPKLAHRIVGYLEEEAIYSYTEFLNKLDKGIIENAPAPAITIDYRQLPQDATLRDVVVVVRADEAHHRDVNHFASDIHHQGLELKEALAPVGYH